MAQESKFTADVVGALIAARSAGKSHQECASAAGITRRTLYSWILLGDRGVEPFATFAASYDAARRQYERARIAAITSAVRPVALQIA